MRFFFLTSNFNFVIKKKYTTHFCDKNLHCCAALRAQTRKARGAREKIARDFRFFDMSSHYPYRSKFHFTMFGFLGGVFSWFQKYGSLEGVHNSCLYTSYYSKLELYCNFYFQRIIVTFKFHATQE